MDANFAPAWIGFGNAFAAQDESDQAMASYRSGARLFSGSHLPGLCIGMEYIRTNNLALATEYIEAAVRICSVDPLVYNELGTILFKQERYHEAKDSFQTGIEMCKKQPRRLAILWEPLLYNLGHVYRKLRQYDDTIRCYQSSLQLCPRKVF